MKNSLQQFEAWGLQTLDMKSIVAGNDTTGTGNGNGEGDKGSGDGGGTGRPKPGTESTTESPFV